MPQGGRRRRGAECVCASYPGYRPCAGQGADARIAKGDAPAMCGLPLGIKDLFCTKDVPSQAASGILEGFKPQYESTVTQNLFDAGAVMLGKLNMDEFAMGSSNETSVYGNAVSPWRRGDEETALTPGGSSGGRPLLWRLIFALRRPGRIPAARSVSRRVYRHCRHQADLWAVFALGHCRFCLVARSGGADDQIGARCGDHA